MIKVNVHEAKIHLSHYLEEVAHGETILLCKINHPVAEVRPITAKPSAPRPLGLAKRVFKVPKSFFDELPEETLALFSGDAA